MGKKTTSLKKKEKKAKKEENLPMVSVCTPTYNRRIFIPQIIKCFLAQDYPKNKLEWIIIDDGTDKVNDLFEGIENVKYYGLNEKMRLGKKRNFMHTKVTGDIIVYMDDDDYYPPCRISHAVERLLSKPEALCAGSSEIYLYYTDIKKMYRFGPYGSTHATAGTFAFKKELLQITSYDDDADFAEEKKFLKDYTIPFVQLEPLKSILVFSHESNTFDKRPILNNPDNPFIKESVTTLKMFIKDVNMRNFYVENNLA